MPRVYFEATISTGEIVSVEALVTGKGFEETAELLSVLNPMTKEELPSLDSFDTRNLEWKAFDENDRQKSW